MVEKQAYCILVTTQGPKLVYFPIATASLLSLSATSCPLHLFPPEREGAGFFSVSLTFISTHLNYLLAS
jgi:hypothetical protein